MHRTQIYLEEATFEKLQIFSKKAKISIAEFIRKAVKKEVENEEARSLEKFLSDLPMLESFKNLNTTEYMDNIRKNSRILKNENSF